MIKKYFKNLLNNDKSILPNILLGILILYLKFVYFTSRWNYIFSDRYSKGDFQNAQGTAIVFWHDVLAFASILLKLQPNTVALVSPHSDGKIINKVVTGFGCGTIEGSTNKNAMASVRQIIRILKSGTNLAITPDGPRGPAHQVNSNITQIVKKYNFKIIAVSFVSTRYFRLKSWDKMMIPLPFSCITVQFSDLIKFSDDKDKAHNDQMLLNALTPFK
ncbi:MAG: lysophospholipid acyltransferase family protein [Rickettsiaceae bacterium]